MQLPHADTVSWRDAKSMQVPVVSPLHAQAPPPSPAWQRREEAHTRPLPQSEEEAHVVAGAEGTVQASPFTQMLLQTSFEQHEPLGHAWHTPAPPAPVLQTPQRTRPVWHAAVGLVVVEGHASPEQHTVSSGTQASPQWCWPAGQSTLPTTPAAPQQNVLAAPPVVQPRLPFPKQPSPAPQ